MATYYVRQSPLSGAADTNAGTSPATAWRTIGKALTSATGGDTVYIGAGHYGESVTVSASPSSELKIIGDTQGGYTGDGGEIIWSQYTYGIWHSHNSVTLLSTNGKSNLTFERITFVASTNGSTNAPVQVTGASTNCTFRRCTFYQARRDNRALGIIVNGGVNANHLIEDCIFRTNQTNSGAEAVHFVLTRHTADYNINTTVRRCLFLPGTGDCVTFNSAGSGTGEGGGVSVQQCTFLNFGPVGVKTWDGFIAGATFTYPITVTDCYSPYGSLISASESGAIVDGGGNYDTNGYTSATRHPTSYSPGFAQYPQSLAAIPSLGHEWLYDLPQKPQGAPLIAPRWNGMVGAGTADMASRPVTEGSYQIIATGTATAATTSTLTDSNKAWAINGLVGAMVRITGGVGAGQVRYVVSNTATALTIQGVTGSDGLWSTTPSTDSTYVIYRGPAAVGLGKATATGSTTTLTDGNASWATGKWVGYTLAITAGTNSGATATITSNTATQLTVTAGTAFAAATDNTTVYSIYRNTNTAEVRSTGGALAMHETARRETGTTDNGVGIVLSGVASHEFEIPVSATATTISVRARFDANHGAGTRPQIELVANPGIGVTGQTVTMTAAADTWERIALAAITPTAAGVVRIRLIARGAAPYGQAFFDSVLVS